MKISLKSAVYGASGLLAASSGFHWVVPVATGFSAIATAAVLITPEISIPVFLYGNPFIEGLLFTNRVRLGWLVLLIIAAIAIAGMFAKRKIKFPRIDIFQIGVFLLFVWAVFSLQWSSNAPEGIHKITTWLITGLLPMELIIMMFYSGFDLHKIPKLSIYIGIIFLALSIFGIKTTTLSPLSRFGISGAGDEWNYARSIGFLFLTSIWFVDKSKPLAVIFYIGIAIASLYFLVMSAVRAPFAAALLLAGIYLLLFSKINLFSKIVMVGIFIGGAIYIISGTYLLQRWTQLQKTVEISAAIRLFMWKTVLHNFWGFLPFGTGLGGWKEYLPMLLKWMDLHHPHNSFLEIYVELGLPGLLLYLPLMFILPAKSVWTLFKKKHTIPVKTRHMLEFALLIWAFGIVNGLVNDALATARFEWITLGMMYVLLSKKNNINEKVLCNSEKYAT